MILFLFFELCLWFGRVVYVGVFFSYIFIYFIFFFAQTSDEIKSVKGIMENEIPQVEQTSSDETNSVKEMETEIQQVEENSEADSLEGKEITAKRGTKPPLNFLAILNDANISIQDFSPDELCNQLYKGVFIEPKKLASSLSISPDLIYIDGTLYHIISSYFIVILRSI